VANKRSRSSSGSLAGWLFADLAIVLAIAFLQSSIGFSDALDDDGVLPEITTTTTTTAQSQYSETGVSIEPCEIKFLRVPNLNNNEEIKANVISKISEQTNCSTEEFYGVVLIFAGNADTNDNEGARARAGDLCESLFETWVAMKRLSTYCEGFKNDGIDSDYFNLTLFPYIPNP